MIEFEIDWNKNTELSIITEHPHWLSCPPVVGPS
jgi:hypothetical protein